VVTPDPSGSIKARWKSGTDGARAGAMCTEPAVPLEKSTRNTDRVTRVEVCLDMAAASSVFARSSAADGSSPARKMTRGPTGEFAERNYRPCVKTRRRSCGIRLFREGSSSLQPAARLAHSPRKENKRKR
jgi:hypothetical protein